MCCDQNKGQSGSSSCSPAHRRSLRGVAEQRDRIVQQPIKLRFGGHKNSSSRHCFRRPGQVSPTSCLSGDRKLDGESDNRAAVQKMGRTSV